ncbi:MAG: HAAS signaling domain-containing protein [Betaproteobacteria bacterium]
MTLSQTGESRVNGYMFVLQRSLSTFLPRDIVSDAVREIESHLRERIAASDGTPNERDALERILAELGPPLRVAQAYSTERIIDEAVTTGRVVPILRAIWHMAMTTISGFFVGLGLLIGYAVAGALVLVAIMKPVFPDNTGIWVGPDTFAIGAHFPPPPGLTLYGGYWFIPFALAGGLAILVLTHRLARRLLARWQARRSGASGGFVG